MIGGVSDLRIVEGAGIKRHCPPQELRCNNSLFVLRQRLEIFGCLTVLGAGRRASDSIKHFGLGLFYYISDCIITARCQFLTLP